METVADLPAHIEGAQGAGYTVTPNNPRAMQADVLAGRIQAMGVEALPCGSIPQAVQAAMDFAGRDGVACALGSLYMSGEIRDCFQ